MEEKIFACLILGILVVSIIILGAGIFMLAWNAFVPAVFGGPTITFIQALAAWVLIGIIGGSFRSYTSK